MLEVIRDCGLPLHVVFNRTALMVLPAGVHKGTGLAAALARLGVHPAHAVAIGDAENDQPMLALCGYGAAVANAVYDATGVRLRRVPFRPARVLAALKSGGVA